MARNIKKKIFWKRITTFKSKTAQVLIPFKFEDTKFKFVKEFKSLNSQNSKLAKDAGY